MFGLGLLELLIILAIVLLLFGTKRIPNVVRGLGEGIRNFRRELRGDSKNRAAIEDRDDRPSDPR